MAEPIILAGLVLVYKIAKYWVPVIALIWGAFKVVTWSKETLVYLKERVHSLNESTNGLRKDVENQTNLLGQNLSKQTEIFSDGMAKQTDIFSKGTAQQTVAFVAEVKELRSDLRSFLLPTLFQSMPQASVRAKSKPTVQKRSAAKKSKKGLDKKSV